MATRKTAPKTRGNIVGAANPRDDDRVHKTVSIAERDGRHRDDAERASDEGTALTAEQRTAMIRNEFQQEALPRLPDIPGWHLCWLSTTASYDPIHKRMRLGYVPVKAEEMRGFESMRMNSGEFEGGIACNEMLLFKVPMEQYQAIMKEFHHNMPLEEEEALKQQLVRETDVDSKGKKLGQITEDSDGFESLGQKRRHAVFEG
jgi:hypothetical protein